mmetsp:Transcript_30928/g.82010  ORF Transcript_30928/g.82010 Transcript_30928/m.82010 type:complete len:544 (+) Transcript_30928:100-1731(+)
MPPKKLAPGYHGTSQYFMDTLRVIAFMEEAELSPGAANPGMVMVDARPSMCGDEMRPPAMSVVEPTHDEAAFDKATTVQEVWSLCEQMLGYQVQPYAEQARWPRPPQFQRLGSRLPFKLAKGPADVTASWITDVMRYQGYLGMDESITSIKSQPIGAGEGEFSELAMVDITGVESPRGAPKCPRSMIAKFSPPGMGSFPLAFTFGSEAHFYNDLSDEGALLVRPQALFIGAQFSRLYKVLGAFSKALYCFVISNANPPDAPSLCFKRVDGCSSIPHLMLAVQGLARMHARWWGSSQKTKELTWSISPKHLGGVMPTLPSTFVTTGWVLELKLGFKALPHLYSSNSAAVKFGEEYREFVEAVRPAIRRRRLAVVRELFRQPLTLIHGDTHLENIFFGKQFQGGAMFIDFGLTQLGHPLSDISELLGTGMIPKVRRAHEEAIVRHYHRCLLEYGVKDFSWEQCWKDYKFQFMRVLIKILHVAPSFVRERKNREGMFSQMPNKGDQKLLAMYKEMNTRLAAALNDHNWVENIKDLPITAGTFRPFQ